MILARAPFRITLGGGGTDLPSYYQRHGGFILSAAIDKYLYICVNRPAADDLVRLKYSRYEEVESVSEIQHDLVRPALTNLGMERNLEIVSLADVPGGTGLGSSSTYLVALLTALHELAHERLPKVRLAELAFHIEADLAGHPVGKQDQYLAAIGGITCLDIACDGTVQVTTPDVSPSTVDELRGRLLLFFTGTGRSANAILGQQHADTHSNEQTVVQSLHETKRIGLAVKAALERGDVDAVGDLMHEHWEAKKRRSSAISSPDIDRWYSSAREAGALGGKIVGAGGGGFLMVCCGERTKADVRSALRDQGLKEMTYDFDYDGAKVLVNF